jgi:hypothetical protein
VWITNEFKDRYVAPNVSRFTAATIPDMSAVSAEQEHWLGNFILNTGLQRVVLEEGSRRSLFNFLRRTMMAFREYASARQMTLNYLANPNPNAVSEYIIAVGHWEMFLSQADQAWDILDGGKNKLFMPNDGTVPQRLRHLHNRTKHLASAIRNQEMQFPEAGTMPVWLENDGLHGLHSDDGITTVDVSLPFDEIAGMLAKLAHFADAAQDPLQLMTGSAASG